MDESRRILLADGDESFRNDMAEALRVEGGLCDIACNSQEIAEKIGVGHYDVLILDVELPGNAGLRVVRELNRAAQGLQIILVTSKPTIESAVDAVHLPVMAYLVKPVSVDQLRYYVQRSITRSRLYRTMSDMQARLIHWNESIEKLRRLLQEPADGDVSEFIGPLLATTFENVVKSVVDLRRVIQVFVTTGDAARQPEFSGLMKKMELTRDALRETIHVLEETKHAFKSKRLGELRRQLQVLMVVLERDDVQLARQKPPARKISREDADPKS